MVKGNNTVKNNKSVTFQPYDVSNSFVKKVTSRVSELLHQPAWIGKWLATPTQGAADHTSIDAASTSGNSPNHDLYSSAEDDLLAEQPPTKRARVPYNPQYTQLRAFPPSDPGTSLGQGVSPIVNHNKISESSLSMPGPSNRMSFVSSTPQVNNCVTNSAATESTPKTNINGDDNFSESSESTSGCSSLVPQDNQSKKNNASASGETSSLSQSRIQHSRINSNTLAARRPSFNPSSFIASSKVGLSPNTSPFYSGRTMYGGASHYRRCSEMGGLFSPSHHSQSLAVRPAVSPLQTSATSGMSSTARRILDALEQFSTPVLDAKRIPLKKQTPRSDERIRPNKRKLAELSSSIPTTPDLLRLKRKERLQDSTSAARHLSSTFSTPASDYSLREEDDETNDSYKGKIKTKRKHRDKEMTVEPVGNIHLPSVSLGITALPKIDIALPPKTSLVSKPTTPSNSFSSSVFKFSKPSSDTFKKLSSSKSNSSESISEPVTQSNVSTQSFDSPSMNFVYKPSNMMPKEKKSISIDKSCQTPVENDKSNLSIPSGSTFSKKVESAKDSDAKAKATSIPSDVYVSKTEGAKTLPTSTVPGFGDKFKKPEGSWECSVCMIQNKPDTAKCIACETPKPASKTNSAVAPTTNVFSSPSPFSTADKSKKLEGIPEAPKTSTNSSSVTSSGSFSSVPGFSDKFKKPEGSWECSVCMVQNKAATSKCVACETDKPGSSSSSSAPALKSSGFSLSSGGGESKFNFGIDKANEPKFNFGVDKASANDKPPASTGFKFGDNGTKTISSSPTFSFGVPSNAKSAAAVTPTPAFKFGAPASNDQKKEESPAKKIDFSAPTPPKTALDVTDTAGEPPAKKTLNFVNPFANVDVQKSFLDGNKNVMNTPKSDSSSPLSKPSVPSFSSPLPPYPSDPSKVTSLPSSSISFGTSAFSSGSAFGSPSTQSTLGQPISQTPKAVQDTKVESTSTQPAIPSSVTSNNVAKPSFFDSGSVFKPATATGGFSFASSTAEKPKESLFGNVEKPKESVFGGADKPKESVFGGMEKPKDSLFGGVDKPKESLFGGVEKSKESIFGSVEPPKENVFGSADKPQTNLFGSSESKTGVASPQLGNNFGSPAGGFAFGNTSSAPSSNAFSFGGAKPAATTPAPSFGVSSNPSVFSYSSAQAAPVSASPFASTNSNSFSSPFQSTATTTAAESKPVFSFGSTAAPTAPASSGFSFNAPDANKTQAFSFSAPQASNPAPTGGFSFGGAAPAPVAPKPEQSSVFMFKSETPQQNNVFGNPPAVNPSPFGAPANPAPSFGAPTQPSFNFGASSGTPASQPVFAFGGQNANAVQAPVFGNQQVSSTPTFNPTIPTSFNFTGGATPNFSATPSANAAVGRRVIKKAVRRTQR